MKGSESRLSRCASAWQWLVASVPFWAPDVGKLCPRELSWPPWMRIRTHPRNNLIVLTGKGVASPSSGECPELFSQTAFIGNGMCMGIQCTYIAHQSMSKAYSHTQAGITYR